MEGAKSNGELLLYYGFSVRDNVADVLHLTFPLPLPSAPADTADTSTAGEAAGEEAHQLRLVSLLETHCMGRDFKCFR